MKLQNGQLSNFIEKNDLSNGFQESILRLKTRMTKTKKALSENMNPLEKESYHFISRLLVPETRWDKILYSHIFNVALQSEKLSAGSSYISVLTAISFIETLLKYPDYLHKNEYEVMEDYHYTSNKLQEAISNMTNPLTKELSSNFIKGFCGDEEKLITSILEAVELAGMEGNIQIENGESDNYSVELRYGYHFPAKVYKAFLPSFGAWMQYNCKIFLVDGIIEKVSELDGILRSCYETKIPMVIVAQGFGEDVLSTIKTNNDRKNFNVFPTIIGTDLNSLNVLNDISAATGCKVLSTLTGDMLIYTKYDDLPLVDIIKCTEEGMLIQNSKNRGEVGIQIQSLLEKRKDQHNRGVLDITSLFDKRISNLLAHTVVIRLPNFSKVENEYVRMKIDSTLRTIKALVAYGFLNLSSLPLLNETLVGTRPLVDATKETIDSIVQNYKTNDKIPTLSVALGVYLTGKAMIQLMCSSGIVVLDQK